ncbi:SDR family NAD(P)-dependent oxidoreductase [Hyphomonas sp.]|uniref:SDR family NAD(P)-dependent oxidoreductase n=1 Tax=Hyphomonas sp. TaxID=87 RepID=UPI003F6F4E49
MTAIDGSVAVITGGASGLGFAMAEAAVARGCKLVIADIREDALKEAEARLSEYGEVLAVRVDVANADEVENFAKATVERFGKVNLLINNAGVFATSISWETTEAEYDWVTGVNQKSVFNGIRSFVPRMIVQGDPCHIVTISSGAGITVNPGFCTYSMTKHAVVGLTEALYLDIQAQGIANIGVTIALPGMTQSGIMHPEKTTPGGLQEKVGKRKSNNILKTLEGLMTDGVKNGLAADDLAQMVFDAVSSDSLYVLPAFNDEESVRLATAIGVGRATGQNPYPSILDGFLQALKATETAAGKG